jgi:cysteine desulfurase / selenocysteine lyase
VSLDVAALRAEMPITETWNYLNHATHGPFPRRTTEAVSRVAGLWECPPEMNDAERQETIQAVRRNIAAMINGRPEGVAFTGNLAESISLAAAGIDWQPGDNAVVPEFEFPSVVYPFLGLEHRGVELRLAPKDESGFTCLERIESVMDGRTRAVALSHVEFRDGFKNDLAALGRLCRERDALLIVDATQSMGPCVIDLQACDVDVIAAHGYKWLMSSYGVGVMHFSERAIERVRPTYVGRLSVDKHFEDLDYELAWRAGADRYQTGGINWLSLAALRASTDLVVSIGVSEIKRHTLHLAERLLDGVENKGYHVTSSRAPENRSAIVSFSTRDHARDGEIVEELKRERIAVSLRGRGVRVSPYFYNTESEIDLLIDALPAR